jgi:hypothetical protein
MPVSWRCTAERCSRFVLNSDDSTRVNPIGHKSDWLLQIVTICDVTLRHAWLPCESIAATTNDSPFLDSFLRQIASCLARHCFCISAMRPTHSYISISSNSTGRILVKRKYRLQGNESAAICFLAASARTFFEIFGTSRTIGFDRLLVHVTSGFNGESVFMWRDKKMYNHLYRDVEADLVAYVMGLWHMHNMHKMRKNYSGAIKLKSKESI